MNHHRVTAEPNEMVQYYLLLLDTSLLQSFSRIYNSNVNSLSNFMLHNSGIFVPRFPRFLTRFCVLRRSMALPGRATQAGSYTTPPAFLPKGRVAL